MAGREIKLHRYVMVILLILFLPSAAGFVVATTVETMPPPLVDWDKVGSTISLISYLVVIVVIIAIIVIAILIWKFFKSMGFRKDEVMEITRTAGKAIDLASTPHEEVGYRFGSGLGSGLLHGAVV